jgi:hypothetical protein
MISVVFFDEHWIHRFKEWRNTITIHDEYLHLLTYPIRK